MTETWIILKDYPDYCISNKGNFKSMPRAVTYRDGRVRTHEGKALRYYVNNKGYSIVRVKYNGRINRLPVHRLVALAFLEKPESVGDLVVDHLDRDKQNNQVENLQWVSRSWNVVKSLISDPHRRKLNFSLALQIRKEYLEQNLKNKSVLARKYGASFATIDAILRGSRYKECNYNNLEVCYE